MNSRTSGISVLCPPALEVDELEHAALPGSVFTGAAIDELSGATNLREARLQHEQVPAVMEALRRDLAIQIIG